MQSLKSGSFLPLCALAGALLLASAPQAEAASIGLDPTGMYPDLTTSAAALSYSYTAVCARQNNATIFGVCGTGSGQNAFTGAQNWSLSYGRLTVTKDGSQTLNIDGTGVIPVSNTAGTNYSLTVILGFNATGSALSGILVNDPYAGDALYTSSMGAYGLTSDPGFQTGTLITGTPTSAVPYGYAAPFGYSGSDAAGTFELVFNNAGGDMAAFAGATAGMIIVSTFSLAHPSLPTGAPVETWDSKGINFWKNNFSASSANVDTLVPVPPAVWLFGSALASFGWLRRRTN